MVRGGIRKVYGRRVDGEAGSDQVRPARQPPGTAVAPQVVREPRGLGAVRGDARAPAEAGEEVAQQHVVVDVRDLTAVAIPGPMPKVEARERALGVAIAGGEQLGGVGVA